MAYVTSLRVFLIAAVALAFVSQPAVSAVIKATITGDIALGG